MQTGTFQKVLSLIAHSPYSASPEGPVDSLSPLGKRSFREKKGTPHVPGFESFSVGGGNGCWGGKHFVWCQGP